MIEPSFDVVSVLGIAAIGQALLLTVFLMSKEPHGRVGSRLLAILLLAMVFNLTHHLLAYSRYMIRFAGLFGTGGVLDLAFGPLVYLYVLSRTESDFQFHPKSFLHFVPLLIFQVHKSPHYALSTEIKQELLVARYQNVAAAAPPLWGAPLFEWLGWIQPAIYLALSLLLLHRHHEQMAHNGTPYEKMSQSWTRSILYGFAIVWITTQIAFPVIKALAAHITLPFMFLSFAQSVPIILLGYLAMNNPGASTEPLPPRVRYPSSSLTLEQMQAHAARLSRLMQREQPHLHSGLTLDTLADRLGIPGRALSQTLNDLMRTSFYDFVNKLRVDKAKQLLRDPDCANLTIEAIGEASGFKSRQVFYQAFRKLCKTTPGQFKCDREHPI